MRKRSEPLHITEVHQPDDARVLAVLVEVLRQAAAARAQRERSEEERQRQPAHEATCVEDSGVAQGHNAQGEMRLSSDAPPQSDRAPTD